MQSSMLIRVLRWINRIAVRPGISHSNREFIGILQLIFKILTLRGKTLPLMISSRRTVVSNTILIRQPDGVRRVYITDSGCFTFWERQMIMRKTLIFSGIAAIGMLAASASAQFNYNDSYGGEGGQPHSDNSATPSPSTIPLSRPTAEPLLSK